MVDEALLLVAIYALAGVTHGMVGFAFAVVSVPLISLLYSPATAVGMNLIIGPLLMLYNVWLHRREIAFRSVIPLLLVGVVFIPAGAVFLQTQPESLIMITLGFVVIALTLVSAFAEDHLRSIMRVPGLGYGFAMLSGFISGAFSSGGPPIVAYLYNTNTDRRTSKANVQLFFLIFALTALMLHLQTGVVNGERALRALPFVPVAFVSIRIGGYIASKLSTPAFKWVTDAGLIALGVYLIVVHV